MVIFLGILVLVSLGLLQIIDFVVEYRVADLEEGFIDNTGKFDVLYDELGQTVDRLVGVLLDEDLVEAAAQLELVLDLLD